MPMKFGDAIGEGFFNYAFFNQRAARAEYWWWILFAMICLLAAVLLDSLAFRGWKGPLNPFEPFVVGGPFYIVIGLALFLPSLSVTVRRLHDTNKSGWWLLFPYVSLFIWFLLGFNFLYQRGLLANTGGRSANNTLVSYGITANLFLPVGILTLIFFIVLFVFTLLPGEPGNNKYGPNRYAGAGPDRYGAIQGP